MAMGSTSMYDAQGNLVGYVRIGADGVTNFRSVDNTDYGTTAPDGWTTIPFTPVSPGAINGGTVWWLSTNLGGTVDEATGTAVFPGGPRFDLTDYNGDMLVDVNDTVVSGVNVLGKIIVTGSNVVLHDLNCYGVDVTPTEAGGPSLGAGPIIEYCKINPPNCWQAADGAMDAGIRYNNYTVLWTEITNTFEGCRALGNVSIDNCWIHDMSPCSDAGNVSGGFVSSSGIRTGGSDILNVTNCAITNAGNLGGIYIIRDQSDGTDEDPIDHVSITNVTITQCGNYGLWIAESDDPAIPETDYIPLNVTVDAAYLGCASQTTALFPVGTETAPTFRGKLNLYFPTTTWDSSGWGNVYSLNGTPLPDLIPYKETYSGGNYCNIQIVP